MTSDLPMRASNAPVSLRVILRMTSRSVSMIVSDSA